MTLQTNPQMMQQGKNQLLFDATLIASPDSKLFQPDWLQHKANLQATSSGRGQSWFIDFQNQHWVLRHYLRGGMMAIFNRDVYFSWQASQTRAWKEWQLLHHMRTLHLPVPRPVAARAYWPAGQLSGLYRADILLEAIPNSNTLDNVLQQQVLPSEIWNDIGSCIKQFHTHDIYHADLNANNILIDAQQKVYLIDFDRCHISHNTTLKAHNLPRLQRSLLKLQAKHPDYNFTEQNWQTLMAGYADNTSA